MVASTVASVKVASTDPRSGLGGPRTALASGGVALFLAGAFIQTFSTRATGEPGSNDTMSFEHDSTREGEWGGRRASVRMTTAVDFHVSGSRLEGTVTLTVAATLLDADGNTTGTVTLGMTATVDVDACPDLDGAVHAHFDAETTVNADRRRDGRRVRVVQDRDQRGRERRGRRRRVPARIPDHR